MDVSLRRTADYFFLPLFLSLFISCFFLFFFTFPFLHSHFNGHQNQIVIQILFQVCWFWISPKRRSSQRRCSVKKGVLINFAKFSQWLCIRSSKNIRELSSLTFLANIDIYARDYFRHFFRSSKQQKYSILKIIFLCWQINPDLNY